MTRAPTRHREDRAGETFTPTADAALTPRVSARRRWLKRAILILSLYVLAMFGGCWWWGAVAESRLQAKLAACRAAGQPVRIEDFATPPVPDAENAAEFLTQAAAQMVSPPASLPDLRDLLGDPTLFADHSDAIGRHIATNAAALALVRQASALDRADWHTQLTSPLFCTTLMTPSGDEREIARLVELAALYDHQAGNDNEAFACLHDLDRLVRHVNARPPHLITVLVGLAIDTLVCEALERILPDLRVADAQSSATPGATAVARGAVEQFGQRLLDERDLCASWTRAFYGERLMMLDLVEYAEGSQPVSAASGTPPASVDASVQLVVALLPGPLLKLDAARSIDYCAAGIRAIEAADWPTAQRVLPPPIAPQSLVEQTAQCVAGFVLPQLDRALQLLFAHRATRRLTATAVAIRLYELDHGHRPLGLEDLVPRYLPDVPRDLFDPQGGPIRYLPDHSPPLLYSVGLNGVDEGGAQGFKSDGRQDWRAKDLLFYLNGDRPPEPRRSSATSAPTSAPASSQTLIDDGHAERGDGDQ